MLKAISHIEDDNIAYVFVGGKAIDTYLEYVEEKHLKNVHFIGYIQKEQLKEYYMAADVFVHPTREDIWGLVINESMDYGLPVVTTDRCIAGLELVQNGINGFVVTVDSSEEIGKAIMLALDDREKMGKALLSIIAKYTIENMVAIHMDAFKGDKSS